MRRRFNAAIIFALSSILFAGCGGGSGENSPAGGGIDITKFEIAGQKSSSINGTAISVTMPFGTDKKSLVPTIIHTGTGISPASGAEQNFTDPVTYTVTGTGSSKKEYTVTVTEDAPSIEKATIEKIAGTWVRTFSEKIMDEETGEAGTETTTTSKIFSSDGTFLQIDRIFKDYTDADGRTDTTTYRAFKGSVSISDTIVTCSFSGKVLDAPSEITDVSLVKWDTFDAVEKFPSIIIEGRLYEDDVFRRTGSGTGISGEWVCETIKEYPSSYSGEKMTYAFDGSAGSVKIQNRDSADGEWQDGLSYSMSFVLTDATHLSLTMGGMTVSYAILAAGDYLIMGTDKGYSKK